MEARLSRTLGASDSTKHIKSLGDVKELRLTANRAFRDNGPEHGDTYVDFNETAFVCPVTAMVMNGANDFYVNWLCGCVISAKAIQEVCCPVYGVKC